MARSFLESAGINGDSVQQAYQAVGINGGEPVGEGYDPATCVDANGYQTVNYSEDGYQTNAITGNGYQAVVNNGDGYQSGLANGGVYQTTLDTGDRYQTGLDNGAGYQTNLDNGAVYQTGLDNKDGYQTAAINSDRYQAVGGVHVDGGYQVVNGDEYQAAVGGSANDHNVGQFYQWTRQEMYNQDGQQQIVSQLYSTANQNTGDSIKLKHQQQVMGLDNAEIAALYRYGFK